MNEVIELNELRQIQLEIMDVVDFFCRTNGIRYYITAGTLIGALRHRGYIPWDDDIDIVMLRDDYERFIHKFAAFDGRYKVDCFEINRHCTNAYAKVYDDTTIMYQGNEDKNQSPIGINIDVFPLDYVTDNYQDAVDLKNKIKLYDNIITVKNIVRKNRGFKKNISLLFLKVLCSFFSYSWCVKHINHIARQYEMNKQSRYVVNAVIYAKGEREILEREWFSDALELQFENRKYLAPIGADLYMRRLFGDYMQLPPEDKRVTHHSFKAYRKD